MRRELRHKVYAKCGGRCAYCGQPLELKDMQIDHLKPILRGSTQEWKEKYGGNVYGDDTIDNMLPSCRSCNNYKSSSPLDSWRRQIENLLIQLNRISIYRIAKRYGLITENPKRIEFYFEQQKWDMI